MESRFKIVFRGIIILVAILCGYFGFITYLNAKVAFKVQFDSTKGYRCEFREDFYYIADSATIISPVSSLTAIKSGQTGEEDIDIDFMVTYEKKLFGKDIMYLRTACEGHEEYWIYEVFESTEQLIEECDDDTIKKILVENRDTIDFLKAKINDKIH